MTAPVILVADDHASLRALIAAMLRRADAWDVVQAVDGSEALAVCRSRTVDLAILDERMPGHNGTDVARTLRGERFRAPIVLFSAYLDPEVEEEAAELGLITLAKSDIDRLADLAHELIGGDTSSEAALAPV